MERKTAERGQIKGKIEGRERYVRTGWKFKQWGNKKVLGRYFFRSTMFCTCLSLCSDRNRFSICNTEEFPFVSLFSIQPIQDQFYRLSGSIFLSTFRVIQISSRRRSVADKFSALRKLFINRASSAKQSWTLRAPCTYARTSSIAGMEKQVYSSNEWKTKFRQLDFVHVQSVTDAIF